MKSLLYKYKQIMSKPGTKYINKFILLGDQG